jgi:hypothetical protein
MKNAILVNSRHLNASLLILFQNKIKYKIKIKKYNSNHKYFKLKVNLIILIPIIKIHNSLINLN